MSCTFRLLALFAAFAAFGRPYAAHSALPREYVRIKASDFDRGYVRGRVSEGESFDFTAPASASCSTNASLRGGATDYVRIRLPWWRFRLGGGEYSELVALGDGTVWLADGVSIPSVFSPLGIVPSDAWSELPDSCAATCPPLGITTKTRLSVMWHEVTLDSVRITWQNALLSRDRARPVSYQVELFRNGDFTARLDLSRAPAGDRVFIYARSEFGVARPTSVRWHRLTAGDMVDSDIDGDGIDTEREILDYGTDPRSPDTDGDSLYDLAESYSNTSPLTGDTDGDRFGDATDPHPRHLDWWRDEDGDGFPDAWRAKWFPAGELDPYADAGGDGVPNLASCYVGVSPMTTWALGTHAQQKLLPANCVSWRFAPGRFSFERPVALTNLVDRTFHVDRTSPWQQLFLMSDTTLCSGWSAGDVVVRWEAGGESGVAPLESWDSWRIPVSATNAFTDVRLTLEAAGQNPRLDRPLFLVMWTPQLTLGTTFNAYWSLTNPKTVFMARNGDDGAYRIPCTVSRTGYPHVGGIDEEAEAALARPMLPGVELQGDEIVVDGPRTFQLPRCGSQGRITVVVYHIDW